MLRSLTSTKILCHIVVNLQLSLRVRRISCSTSVCHSAFVTVGRTEVNIRSGTPTSGRCGFNMRRSRRRHTLLCWVIYDTGEAEWGSLDLCRGERRGFLKVSSSKEDRDGGGNVCHVKKDRERHLINSMDGCVWAAEWIIYKHYSLKKKNLTITDWYQWWSSTANHWSPSQWLGPPLLTQSLGQLEINKKNL